MKSIYVCNVSTSDDTDDALKLPSTAPDQTFKGAEQVRSLRANPHFGAGADEEPLPMPSTFAGGIEK